MCLACYGRVVFKCYQTASVKGIGNRVICAIPGISTFLSSFLVCSELSLDSCHMKADTIICQQSQSDKQTLKFTFICFASVLLSYILTCRQSNEAGWKPDSVSLAYINLH